MYAASGLSTQVYIQRLCVHMRVALSCAHTLPLERFLLCYYTVAKFYLNSVSIVNIIFLATTTTTAVAAATSI